MRIRTLGRGVPLEPHRHNGHVLVPPHRIDACLDLAQLLRVTAVVGVNLRFVYWEVNKCRTRQRAAFHHLGFWAHKHQFREERLVVPPQRVVMFRHDLVTTSPIAVMQLEYRPVHPFLVYDGVIIVYIIRLFRGSINRFVLTRDTTHTVTHIVVVSLTPINSYRR